MTNKQEGYGVCRNVEDAKEIATTAERSGLRGCYPSAAVVLASALVESEKKAERNAPPFDYIGEAMRTNSPSWHGSKVNFPVFQVVLQQAIEALRDLDAIKKTLYYGRELPKHLQVINECEAALNQTCEKLPNWFKNDTFGECAIHGIIGAATEAGELLEALQNTVVNGKEFDEVNTREEVGDVFWYIAVLADTCGFTFDEAQRVNIAKLRARYPEKFTAFNANNRNLVEERRILEGEEISS